MTQGGGHQAAEIGAGDPAHPLLAVPEGATEAQAEHRQHLAEGASIGPEHDADPQNHDAAEGLGCLG